MAATLLIVLLLVLAGAALGIWAAPQIAPRLPSGLAPVADWLSPRDGEIETRLATVEDEAAAQSEALRAEIAAVHEELAAASAPADVSELEARMADVETRLGDRIEEIAGGLAAIDGGATRERVNQLEASIRGIEETLASLRDQLAEARAAGDDSAEIDAYRAEVAGLRGEMQGVASQVAQLSSRIDEVGAQASRQVELARAEVAEIEAEAAEQLTQAETEAALAQVRSSLEAGTPYDEAAARLASATGVPVALLDPASEGVASLQELRQSFSDAASAAIRADIQARGAEGGFLERLRGFAESQVASRSIEPRAGVDADSVLSRMQAALNENDLDRALEEAEALPPAAASDMEDWLNVARTRQQAVESFEALQAELSATN